MSKILVIGDSCKDIFRYGEVNRIAPEAPIPIIKPEKEVSNLGMAGNVVANLKSLGAEVDFITNKKEIKKIRYICSKYNHPLLRVDENDQCDRIDIENVLCALDYSKYDAVVISDYCKGFINHLDIQYIAQSHPLTFLDTKRILGNWADKITFIKINNNEYKNNKEVLLNNPHLSNKVITTLGPRGCQYKGTLFPTQEVPVKDVSGAGDTFLSGLVYDFIQTKDIESSIKFAQKCTTVVVQQPGVSVIKI
jgi:bifunctional ADP-heptose synthase (sugar kinase/adenylyltransferase)